MAKKNPPQKRPRLSWVAFYWRTGDAVLLGGVTEACSSRFGTKADAQAALDQYLTANRDSGRECDGEVRPNVYPPELFRHCGNAEMLCVVGSTCPVCGTKVTVAEARDWAEKQRGVHN